MASYHQNLKRKKRKGRKVTMKRKRSSRKVGSKHKKLASVKEHPGIYKTSSMQFSDSDPTSQHLYSNSAVITSLVSTPVSQEHLNQPPLHSLPVSHKQQNINHPFKSPQRGKNRPASCLRVIWHSTTLHSHTSRMLELEQALPFMTKVKARFLRQPDVYEKFILLLHMYDRGQENGDAFLKGLLARRLSETELYALVKFLFQEEEDLAEEFKHFLSNTDGDSVKTEGTDTDIWLAEFLEALDKMKELMLYGHRRKLKTEENRKYYMDVATDAKEMDQNKGVGLFLQEATIPTENEEMIVSHVMKLESQGYKYTVASFYELIIDVMSPVISPNQNLAESLNDQNFADISKLPIICYLKKQHPYMNIHDSQCLTLESPGKMPVRHKEQYFEELRKIFMKYELQKRPEAIFCVDEVGILLGAHATSKVVRLKGRKMCRTDTRHKDMVSIAICGNAKGHCIPPFVVFKKNLLCTSLLKGCIPGTAFTENNSGWMTARTAKNFLLHFQKCTYVKPSLLLYDPCTLHVTPSALQQAFGAGIILFPLPPQACSNGSTLHPMNICFSSLVKSWRNMMDEELMDLGSQKPVTKYTVNRLLPYLYCLALLPINIKTGFESTRIYPFQMDGYSKRKQKTGKQKGRCIEAAAGIKTERQETEVMEVGTDSKYALFQQLEGVIKEEASEKQYSGNMDVGISAHEEPEELSTSSGSVPNNLLNREERIVQYAEDNIKKEVTVVKCEPYESDAGFSDDIPVSVQIEVQDEPGWTVMTPTKQFHNSDGACAREQFRTYRQQKADALDPLAVTVVMGDTQHRNKADWASSDDANKRKAELEEIMYTSSVSSDFARVKMSENEVSYYQPTYNLSPAEIEHFADISMPYRCENSQDTVLEDIKYNKLRIVKQEKVPYLSMSYDSLPLERGKTDTAEIRIICPFRENIKKEVETVNSSVAVTDAESAPEIKYIEEDYNHSGNDPLFVDVKSIENCNSDSTIPWLTPGVDETDTEASCHHIGPGCVNTEVGDVEYVEAPTCDPLAFDFEPEVVHDPLQIETDCKEISGELSSHDLLVTETNQKENSAFASTHSFVVGGRDCNVKHYLSGETGKLRKRMGQLENLEKRATQCSIGDKSVQLDKNSKSEIINEPSEGRLKQEEGKAQLVLCSQEVSSLQCDEWLSQGKEQSSIRVKKKSDGGSDVKAPFVCSIKNEWETPFIVENDADKFKTENHITGVSEETADELAGREPGDPTDGVLSLEDKDNLSQTGPAYETADNFFCVDEDQLLLSDWKSPGQHMLLTGNEHNCITCGKIVRSGAREERTHISTIRDYPFRCDTCGKVFNYSIHLKLHRQKCMKCSACRSSYTCLSSSKKHEKGQTGKNCIMCESCGKTFKFSLDYKNHHSKCVYKQNSVTNKPRRFKTLLRVMNRLQKKSNQKIRVSDNGVEMEVPTEELKSRVPEELGSDNFAGKKIKTYLRLRNK